MLKSPFPASISFVGISGAVDYTLQPAEALCLSIKANEKRRAEFTRGRAAANRALLELGVDPAPPVTQGSARQPIWPDGICGSISHCGDTAIAAVGRKSEHLAIGVDIQSILQHPNPSAALIARIATPEEASWIKIDQNLVPLRTAILFSAKESLYKALFPLVHRYIGFKEVRLSWSDENHCFLATLQFTVPGCSEPPAIGVKIQNNLVFTYIFIVSRSDAN